MYGAGPSFDDLLDRLNAMGADAPRFGRLSGCHDVWLNVRLPGNRVVEQRAETIDSAARSILDLYLTAPDAEQEAAKEALA